MRDPAKILFETYTDAEPLRPTVGDWHVEDVTFFARGNYLLVEYAFSGRWRAGKRQLEIYETASWRKVWHTDDVRLHGVALAPNGALIAYVRDAKLIICQIRP